jgi:hypothetical protein
MTNSLKRFFQNENGRYVVAQWPNVPAYLAFGSLLLTRMSAGTDLYRLFERITFGTIFLWSYLEITQGESPFRRVLGAGVMTWLLGTTAARA